ncbi:MAG: four helix bundle protein [Gemmatimonadaceae bacterium]|nr:four helix bundle protein [Gemmatimonadaceae bacterium]MCW5827365.1 four helix bundle protein [Gemmatimonadaceae bacterium]
MHPFRRLAVWEKAHALTLLVYPITEGQMVRRFPGLAHQLRRAISSIPANIVEGAGLGSQAQFNRHLTIALASAREAEYHLLLAKDLGAIDLKTFAVLEARLGEIQAMLNALGRRVRERISSTSPSKRRTAARS